MSSLSTGRLAGVCVVTPVSVFAGLFVASGVFLTPAVSAFWECAGWGARRQSEARMKRHLRRKFPAKRCALCRGQIQTPKLDHSARVTRLVEGKGPFPAKTCPKLTGLERFRKTKNGLRGRKTERLRAIPGPCVESGYPEAGCQRTETGPGDELKCSEWDSGQTGVHPAWQ